ncbi:MAG: methionine--tRNA ligase [Methanobacteriaceae archaeon]|nr:methionine--tRNA ligase [Methanobacteriaceae archaeon]
MSKLFISCALPYANGSCHLGHLRSTYIPADIYARYNRMNGVDVLMVCATDEHGTPIAVRAEKENKNPLEITDKYYELICNDLKNCNISLDSFRRTTDKLHYDIAQQYFLKLYNNGFIYDEEIEQLYCEHCKRSLPDRYVEGICPYCGEEGARGDQCEVCGRHLNPTELKEPYCLICGNTPKVNVSNQYFFKLSHFQDGIKNWLETNNSLPDNVHNYAYDWVKDGLRDWILTRDMSWGVPVPLEGVTNKVLYVWGEAFLGYISSAANWAHKHNLKWEDYWNDKVVHFIGKDIIYHHTIFWPGMLMGNDCKLPDSVVAGGYLSLEGRKMSTSKGWVIWVEDFLKDFDSDLLRYYMIVNAPLSKDTDFSWDDFQRRINDELADILGNFLHRTFSFTERFFEGKIPQPGKLDKLDEEYLTEIKNLSDEVGKSIENFEFREGFNKIMKISKYANKYFNDKKPWKAIKENPEEAATCLYLSNQLAYVLSIVLTPYLPGKTQEIRKILNIPTETVSGFTQFDNRKPKIQWSETKNLLEIDHKINSPSPIFNKLPDEIIKDKKEELYNTLKEEEKNKEEDENMSNLISIDEFGKVELKVGQIKEAENIDGSKNLLKLQVDIKEDELRQVVAGIAKKYSPEELIDKKVIVVTNLEPAKLFGVKSEGMLLATDSMNLLTTEGKVGESIK